MPSQNSNRRDEYFHRDDGTAKSLIEQLKDNSPVAWKRLCLLYEPLICFWCYQLKVPEQDKSDIAQDVFQTVAKSIGSFSFKRNSGTFRGWLKTITRSRVIDWRRRMAEKPRAVGGSAAKDFFAGQPFDLEPDYDDNGSIAEKGLTQELHANALRIIRASFRERTWQAFLRVVVDGQSPKDVAAELDMKPNAVRVAKSRVLHRLRAELGEVAEEDAEENR